MKIYLKSYKLKLIGKKLKKIEKKKVRCLYLKTYKKELENIINGLMKKEKY